MSGLSKRAAEVERELGAEWTRYHVGAQVTRFLVGVFTTVLWSMHNGFSDWTDLLPLVGTAAWTTAAQMFPKVPWELLREHFVSGPDKAPGDSVAPGRPVQASGSAVTVTPVGPDDTVGPDGTVTKTASGSAATGPAAAGDSGPPPVQG